MDNNAFFVLHDATDTALAWFAELQAAQQNSGAVNPLSLGAVIGPEARQMTGNFAQNLKEGRARLMQIIAQRDRKRSAFRHRKGEQKCRLFFPDATPRRQRNRLSRF